MLYLYIAFGVVGLAILLFVLKAGRSVLERRYYERQGVAFTTTYPFIGSEVDITGLIHRNKTRDYLYVDKKTTDFVGSIRGFDVQLYAVNRETTEILVHPSNIGTFIDRDTPALYSFGQLSPAALTFTPMSTENFQERKLHIAKGFDRKRMNMISGRLAEEYCDRFESGTLDMKRIVSDFTREVMGEFVWGREAMNVLVPYKDRDGKKEQVPFMFALNETFTRLRFYSNRFWNRVYFPIATWPVTVEARRLQYNIRALQAHLAVSLKQEPAADSVSHDVIKANGDMGISMQITRDDLLTASIAGLDTVQSMSLASLWYILQPENDRWRQAIINSDGAEQDEIVEACISEAIRIDPPGSVINNKIVKDFEIEVSGRKYLLKTGTRVMPNIHALHAEYGDVYQPERFLGPEGKSVYVMPFGKGRRSCPGRTIGTLMSKNFVKEFITRNPAAVIMNTEDEHIHFNNLSRSQLFIDPVVRKDKVDTA